MIQKEDIVFSRNSVEFVTVAAEYCAFIERAETLLPDEFVKTILKLLPLLYLKVQMVSEEEPLGEEDLESFVTQENYEIIRITIAELLSDKDAYLDVFVDEMKYSDTPVTKYISEDLSDIYQDLKNFVSLFKLGVNETMRESLLLCREHFELYWGQTLVNTLRALHEIKYSSLDNIDEESMFA